MITLNQTAGNDNSIIWLIEVELDSSTLYFCSGFNRDSISLDNGSEMQVYQNKLQKGSLSTYSQSIPASDAGGIGSRSGFMFVLAAFGGYDINDFYPATGGDKVTMKPARLGFVWSGATMTSEITWIFEGEVENFEAHPDGLYFDVTESNFLEYLTLPPYKVQKDFNDNHTYFPNAPDASIGLPIPIVYGRFEALDETRGKYRLAPGLLVDLERLKILAACHKCDYTYYDVDSLYRAFSYLDGSESYIELVPSAGSHENSFNGHHVNLTQASPRSGTWLHGNVTLWRKLAGAITDITDVSNIQERNYQNDIVLPDTDILGLQFVKEFDSSFGTVNIGSTDIQLVVLWRTSVNTEQRTLGLKFYNYIKSGGSGYTGTTGSDNQNNAATYKATYYNIGNVTDGKSNATLPWTWDELLNLQWVLTNLSGVTGGSTSGDIRIKNVYLKVNYVIISSMQGTLTKLQSPVKVKIGKFLK